MFIYRDSKHIVDSSEIIKALGKDKLLSLGRRYDDGYRSLWIAMVEIDGFVDFKRYRIDGNVQFKKLNSVGYRPGDKFKDGIGYIVFNHGKKLKEPLDLDSIRKAEEKKKVTAEKRAELKKWKNIKTYNDAKEKPDRTKIFAYKGVLGMITHSAAPGIIAKPTGGNLGVVIEAKHCDITIEAKNMLSQAYRENGSFADIQMTGDCFGWLGDYKMACPKDEIRIGRDCDKTTLDKMNLVDISNMTLPKSFVEYINKSK